MAAHQNGTGEDLEWHERLRLEPASTPVLPDHPTPLELARAYASVALAYRQQWPLVVQGLQFLHGATLGAKAAVERVERRLKGEPEPARPKLPSLSEYNPDLTPAGGIRVDPHAWEAVRRQLADQQAALDAAETAAAVAAAREQGAEEARSALEAKSKRFRDWVLFAFAVGGPLLGALVWALTHFAHL